MALQHAPGFTRHEMSPGVRLWQPETDVLHNPNVVGQEPGCEEVLVGLPKGECGGVVMTNQVIAAVSKLSPNGKVAGNHAPTHGADATAFLVAHGAQFGPPETIPQGPYVISAHGAAPKVAREARARGLEVFDATCPLVYGTHRAIANASKLPGEKTIAYLSFGKDDHPELVGAQGVAMEHGLPFSIVRDEATAAALIDTINKAEKGQQPKEATIVIVGQTTNNSEDAAALASKIQELARGHSHISVMRSDKKDVCHTVSDRQTSTRMIVAEGVGALIVVGSVKSKNTKSLAGVAAQKALALDRPLDIILTNSWSQLPELEELEDAPKLEGRIGVVSGASTMAANVDGVVRHLNPTHGSREVGEDTDKGIVFKSVDYHTRKLLQ